MSLVLLQTWPEWVFPVDWINNENTYFALLHSFHLFCYTCSIFRNFFVQIIDLFQTVSNLQGNKKQLFVNTLEGFYGSHVFFSRGMIFTWSWTTAILYIIFSKTVKIYLCECIVKIFVCESHHEEPNGFRTRISEKCQNWVNIKPSTSSPLREIDIWQQRSKIKQKQKSKYSDPVWFSLNSLLL